jgi:hypothetical protein
MELKKYGGFMRILYSIGKTNPGLIDVETKELKDAGFDITTVKHDEMLREELYALIQLTGNNYDVLFVSNSNPYTNEFLDSLKLFKIYYDVDCPYNEQGREFYSHYDHVLVGAYQYDKDKTMMEVAKEWGAKEAEFMPYGVCRAFLDKRDNQTLFFDNRDIDLVFVGNFQNKTARILKIFKAFPNMTIHSQTAGWKGIFRTWYHVLTMKKGWYEGINLFDIDLYKMFLKATPYEGDPLELYSRAKIGLNIHQKNGPVNYRTYELPARGVMQVCDYCEGGLNQVFEVGEEVIGYDTPEEAIREIQYYLINTNDNKRKLIALAGMERVKKDYIKSVIFKRILGEDV